MAQEAILSISLKEYKAQIDELKGSLLGLEQGSEEYKKTLQQVRDMQEKLNQVMYDSKRGADAVEGSYNALTQEMSLLKKEWKATNDEARRNELGQQIDVINSKLKDMDASVGVFSRSVGNYEIAGQSMKSTLREMQEQMAQMLASGMKPTDEEFVALAQRAGQMRDAMTDAKAIVSQFGDDTKTLATALDVAKTGTAVFGAWQGAMSAFGVESENATKAIQKLQGVMTLLNSLQTIQTALVDKQSKTYQLLASLYNKVAVAKKADATATNAVTVATNGATVATNGFKRALIGTGIGAFVVLLGTLVANFDKLVNAFNKFIGKTDEGKKSFDEFKASVESSNEASESLMSTLDSLGKMDVKLGLKTEVDATSDSIERLKDIIRTSGGDVEEALNFLLNAKEFTNSAEAVKTWGDAFLKSSNSMDFANASSKELSEWLRKESTTISMLKGYLKDLENEEKNANKEQKISIERAKEAAQAILAQYDAVMKLQGAYADGKAKDDEAEKKKAEEEEKKREEAKRARQKKLDEAQKAYNKSVATEVDKLKQSNKENNDAVKYAQQLAKAEGKVVDEKKDKVSVINSEIDGLKKEVELYDKLSKDTKLSSDSRASYVKLASQARYSILEKEREKTIVIAEQTSEAWSKKWKEKIEKISKIYSEHINDLMFKNAQIEIGIEPTVEKENVKKSIEELSEYTQDFYASVDKNNPYGFDVNLLDKVYQKAVQLERSYGNELLGVRKATTEDMTKVDMIMAESIHNSILNEANSKRQALEQQLEEAKQSGKDTIDIEKEIAETQKSIDEENTNFFLEQSERRKKARDDEKKNHKEWVNAQIDGFLNYADSVGSLMGSISDIMQENIDQKVKNGEISEEEAKKEFERVKRVQIAELWLSTLSGAAGAFLQDMKSFPSPWNLLIASTDFATAMAMGVAQTKKIKSQTYGSSGGEGGSTVAQAQVSPLLNEALDSNTMTSLNTEAIATKQTDTRVYIVESDIQKSNQRVETREKNTSF